MRLSTSNIDVKFLKALEKYNKYLGGDNLSNMMSQILIVDKEALEDIPGFGNSAINQLIEFRNLLRNEIKLILARRNSISRI